VARTAVTQPVQSTVGLSRIYDLAERTISLQPPPTLSLEEQVVHVYFKNFSMLYKNQDTIRGFLPHLVPMYSNSLEGSALRVATRATALCAISQLPGQKHLAYRATIQYGKSIMAVACALQDPIQARSDETLQATLLLGLFEVQYRAIYRM
jgi:hypothetical protein